MSFEFNPADEDTHGLCRQEIEALRNQLALTRKALVGLVGTDTKEELELEAAIRILPVPDADRMNTINAIQALLQTQ